MVSYSNQGKVISCINVNDDYLLPMCFKLKQVPSYLI
jgi:hypothetical protein